MFSFIVLSSLFFLISWTFDFCFANLYTFQEFYLCGCRVISAVKIVLQIYKLGRYALFRLIIQVELIKQTQQVSDKVYTQHKYNSVHYILDSPNSKVP